MKHPAEHEESLWRLTIAPLVWLAHLLLCYVTVALWCEKLAERGGSLETPRWLALGYTVLALAALVASGLQARGRYRPRGQHFPQEFDTRQSRHTFLGFAQLLLTLLSALGVIYVALPFGFISACR